MHRKIEIYRDIETLYMVNSKFLEFRIQNYFCKTRFRQLFGKWFRQNLYVQARMDKSSLYSAVPKGCTTPCKLPESFWIKIIINWTFNLNNQYQAKIKVIFLMFLFHSFNIYIMQWNQIFFRWIKLQTTQSFID